MTVNQKVVDRCSFGSCQSGILSLTIGETRGVIRRDVLNEIQSVIARDLKLTHVADVEESGGSAHCGVLFTDAGVLHRHAPASKRNQPCSHPPMDVEQGCPLFGHETIARKCSEGSLSLIH